MEVKCWDGEKPKHLQASDLLSEALLLFSQGALVKLSIGLHDAVLGRQHRQHFLKIKILTRERQPQSKTQARIQMYAHTDGRTQEQGKPQGGRHTHTHQQNQITHDVTKIIKQTQAVRGFQAHNTNTHTISASTNTITTNTTATGGMQKERKKMRENRTGRECLTFYHLHLMPQVQCVCVCVYKDTFFFIAWINKYSF